MKKDSAITFVALNLPKEFLDFLEKFGSSSFRIENFNSPEGMMPILKSTGELFIILVNADVLKNDGHNEIAKFLEMREIDHYLGIYPVVALTSGDEEFQKKVLEMGFAVQVISIDTEPDSAKKLIEDIISVSREKLDEGLQLMKRNEDSRRTEFSQNDEIESATGIFSREAFCRRTEEMLKANPDRNYIIVRWDVDRFKVFNDAYGVEAGDEYLRYVGNEFIKRQWQSMTYGHWVADHFVMCIEERLFSGPAIHSYITKVVQKFKPEFEFTVRMGVYRINDKNLSVRLMCDRAALAMDSVKGDFEKRIAYYDDSMRSQLLEEQELLSDMEEALKNNEFVVYYQPQYNFASGKMTGAEALVRWVHPKKGVIRPDKFIPIFEKNGFISHLDEYVWEVVCQTLRRWIDSGTDVVPISVNISRRDIYNPKLCSIILGLIDKYKISPALLRLEITESAYMEDPNQLIKIVSQLKDAGFTLEMDDFGSGYSSLNTLKDVPVDILKLDLKFLVSDGDNTRGGSILTSVVRMANWLQMPVIAEGIETKPQAEFMKSIGCSLMQGFLFSRPVPETEFENIMSAADLELVDDDDPSASLQNAVDFMNISTQNALLFNSFVGGAAIIERSEDKIESIRLNDQFFESIGVTREEYAPRLEDPLGGFPPEEAEKFLKMLDEAKETGKEASCEVYSFPIDDKHEGYWTRNRTRYLASTGNRDLFYVATDNVTPRMKLYQKNIELANELSLIMDSVPCGILKYDQDGDKRIIHYVNQYAANMFGRSVDEFVEKFNAGDWGQLFDEDIEKINALKANAIKNRRESYSGWFRTVKKNGTMGRMYEEAKLSYNPANRKLVSITVIMIDWSNQSDIDVEKFGDTLKAIFDEMFEIDYERDTIELVFATKQNVKDAFDKPLPLSDGVVPWIKNVVAEEYRKKVAKILDVEYVKTLQANNKTPFFEYEVIEEDFRIWLTTALLKVGESKYLVCTKRRGIIPE